MLRSTRHSVTLARLVRSNIRLPPTTITLVLRNRFSARCASSMVIGSARHEPSIKNGDTMAAAAALAIMGAAATSAAATNCETEGLSEYDKVDEDVGPNPLWPSGVPQETIERFVDEILSDSDINISAIPDAVERQIYVSMISLTLSAVYSSLADLHGSELLGHKLRLTRVAGDENYEDRLCDFVKGVSGTVDEAILAKVADRLLANKAVNRPLIPDVVEKKLYVNCLKLVFRLLDAVAASLKITVCGHDLGINIEPASSSRQSLADRAARVSASLTHVDLKAVEDFARQSGAVDDIPPQSFLGRLMDPTRKELVTQLNATMYALALGIVDDLLADTVLTFLSDRIRIDVVPVKKRTIGQKVSTPLSKESSTAIVLDESRPKNLSGTSFMVGVGLGATLGAAVVHLVSTR